MIRPKTDRFRAFIRRAPGVRSVALGLALALAAGCDEQGAEGDRCVPESSHDDCNGGLVCAGSPPSSVVIPFCPENYCCPVDDDGNVTGNNPFCQAGCNGGAAAICAATMDPGACALADGATPQAALALDDAAGTGISAPDARESAVDSGDTSLGSE